MKYRQVLAIVFFSACLRVSIGSAELAVSTLPFIPAAALVAVLCGGTAYLLMRSVQRFMEL